ncbi:MAG: TonB-dependent receptor, partial [Calditrichaceae bacterium]
TGEPLAGANIYLRETTIGTATDEEGMYYLRVDNGVYEVVCDYIGYATEVQDVEISGDVKLDFELTEFLFSKTIEVIADRARDRETPVAYSDINKEKINLQLGSQDIPLVLNTTPSVYSTMQGGGTGDARINVRGFNQRNIAIMINGVPVNDMENGWVYWSNWDGVGDATSSIQLQRGLTAVNLATPSIGGTMNILTDPTANTKGLKYKQEVGNDGFLKSTLIVNSGLINDRFAINGAIVRKLNDGLVDATWTDAWAYYLGVSWNVNEKNRLEFYALGAPQRHGQNLYKQNMAVYDKKYAEDVIDKSMKSKDSDNDGINDWDAYFNQFYEKGRRFNQNWGKVSSEYNGKQAVGDNTFDRQKKNFINERENFYHKPQVNLNWYSELSNDLNLYTILYYSGGNGGGTGLDGKYYRRDANGELSDNNWKYYYGPSPYSLDFNETIQMNAGPAGFYFIDQDSLYKDKGQSLAILRNSRNNQWTVGAISKVNYKFSNILQFTIGVDWRSAEVEHYREIRDLLGGNYFIANDNQFSTGPDSLKIGEKYDYYFTNTINW